MADISWVYKDNGTSTTDGQSTKTTNSISPRANSEVFLCLFLGNYTGAGHPTVTSDAGLTLGSWTLVDSMSAGGARTVRVYRASAGASPGSGTLTVDAEATETWDCFTWRIVDCIDHDSSDVVEQVNKLAHGSRAGIQEGPWDPSMQAGNGALTTVFDITGTGWVPRTNWTNLGSQATGDGTYYGRFGVAGVGQEDTYFGGTMTDGTWGSAMGIEINAPPSGPSGQVVTTKYHDIQ